MSHEGDSPKKPKRFGNHVVIDDDIESDAVESEAEPLLVPALRHSRRRSSEVSAFYRCDEQHRGGDTKSNATAKRRLYIALALATTFFVVELVAGILSNSLALLSDSFHLLSDVAGFAISLVAINLAELPATSRYSYGFHRVEILGAILSTALIWGLTAALVWEAIGRLRNPDYDIDGKMMVITASIGVGINILLAIVLGGHHHHGPGDHHDHSHGEHAHAETSYGSLEQGHSSRSEHGHEHAHDSGHEGHSHDSHSEHGHDHDHDHGSDHEGHSHGETKGQKKKHENINITSAAVHVIGDIVSSIGVLIAGVVIYFYPHMNWVDPLCTFLFSIIVLYTTFRILNTTVLVLMESTPHDIDPERLTADLLAIPGVVSCHELHLWSLTVGKPSMSVHLACSSATIEEYNRILSYAQHKVCSRYGIHHTTIQLEAAHAVVGPSGRRTFTAHCNCLA